MAAAFAFQADVGAEPHDGPFIGTARMRFAQAQQIIELKIGEH